MNSTGLVNSIDVTLSLWYEVFIQLIVGNENMDFLKTLFGWLGFNKVQYPMPIEVTLAKLGKVKPGQFSGKAQKPDGTVCFFRTDQNGQIVFLDPRDPQFDSEAFLDIQSTEVQKIVIAIEISEVEVSRAQKSIDSANSIPIGDGGYARYSGLTPDQVRQVTDDFLKS